MASSSSETTSDLLLAFVFERYSQLADAKSRHFLPSLKGIKRATDLSAKDRADAVLAAFISSLGTGDVSASGFWDQHAVNELRLICEGMQQVIKATSPYEVVAVFETKKHSFHHSMTLSDLHSTKKAYKLLAQIARQRYLEVREKDDLSVFSVKTPCGCKRCRRPDDVNPDEPDRKRPRTD